MKILKMRATFGKLQSAELALGEGLNVIEAPNEGGKSTWSAFLRAMLYGINTKERDRQGYLAEKNRYQPWSGAAMEGSVELLWQGRSVTLRRGPKGSTPFGRFEAVYTGTAELVPGLTGDNAGETLTGVPREVFERSAFVGQGGAAIDGAPALEARIAALASSGEEDVSYSQVERRLRDWLNRRKHNKTGLIPRLEEELADVEETLARSPRPSVWPRRPGGSWSGSRPSTDFWSPSGTPTSAGPWPSAGPGGRRPRPPLPRPRPRWTAWRPSVPATARLPTGIP